MAVNLFLCVAFVLVNVDPLAPQILIVTLGDFCPIKVPLDNVYIEAFLYMTPV